VKNEDVTPNFFMGKVKRHWQDFEWVLGLFDDRLGVARRRYKAFVAKGISEGRRDDLKGGGLIRSHGGWAAVKQMCRAKIFEKSDERILGDGDFVDDFVNLLGQIFVSRCSRGGAIVANNPIPRDQSDNPGNHLPAQRFLL